MSALLASAAQASGRPAYTPANAVRFKASDNVFLKSALAVDFTYRTATVTLPLFEGRSPAGRPVYYIINEASDHGVAEAMGLNYAPKMRHAAGRWALLLTLLGLALRLIGLAHLGDLEFDEIVSVRYA